MRNRVFTRILIRRLFAFLIAGVVAFNHPTRADQCAFNLSGEREVEATTFETTGTEPGPCVTVVSVASPAKARRFERLLRFPGVIDAGLLSAAASLAYLEPERGRPAAIGLVLIVAYRGLTRVVRHYARAPETPPPEAPASASVTVTVTADQNLAFSRSLVETIAQLVRTTPDVPMLVIVPRDEAEMLTPPLAALGYRPLKRSEADLAIEDGTQRFLEHRTRSTALANVIGRDLVVQTEDAVHEVAVHEDVPSPKALAAPTGQTFLRQVYTYGLTEPRIAGTALVTLPTVRAPEVEPLPKRKASRWKRFGRFISRLRMARVFAAVLGSAVGAYPGGESSHLKSRIRAEVAETVPPAATPLPWFGIASTSPAPVDAGAPALPPPTAFALVLGDRRLERNPVAEAVPPRVTKARVAKSKLKKAKKRRRYPIPFAEALRRAGHSPARRGV